VKVFVLSGVTDRVFVRSAATARAFVRTGVTSRALILSRFRVRITFWHVGPVGKGTSGLQNRISPTFNLLRFYLTSISTIKLPTYS
jgi:hypothetical protein